MHRVDTPSAAPALPATAPAGAPGYWTSGDPETATPGTIADEDWFNSIQEEICHVIEAAGIVLDKASRHQLYDAITAIATGTVGGYATEAWVTANFDALGAAAAAQGAAEAYADAAIAALNHPMQAMLLQESAAGGGTLTPSVSFTPPGPGTLFAFGARNNSDRDTTPAATSLTIDGVSVAGDNTELSAAHMWAASIAGGAAVTAAYSATAGVQFSAQITLVYIPNT